MPCKSAMKANKPSVNAETVIPAKRTKQGASPKDLQTQPKLDEPITKLMLKSLTWSKVDIHNFDQVSERISEYITTCNDLQIKPGVVGLACSLGIDRRRLWEIKNGQGRGKEYNVPREVVDLIKRVYDTLELLWEYSMQSGKINPPCGIFLGKNNFGYQDVVDYNITPKADTSVLPSEDLQKRLESLPDE